MQPRVRAARGFTLIEVLVALIVLVLGVLGAAGMTLTALKDSKQSANRSQAVALAYELAEIMRANFQQQAVFLAASAPAAVDPSCYAAGCASNVMAGNEYTLWTTKVQGASAVLPNAVVKICKDVTNLDSITACDASASSPMVIKMSWDEKLNDGTFQTSTVPRLVIPVQPY